MDKKNYIKAFFVCLLGGLVWGYFFYKIMGALNGYTPFFRRLCLQGGIAFGVVFYIAIIIMARCKKLFSFSSKGAQKELKKHEKISGIKEEERIFGTIEYKMLLPRVLCEAILYVQENKIHIAFRYFEVIYAKEFYFNQLEKITIEGNTVSFKVHGKKQNFTVDIKDIEKVNSLKTQLTEKGVFLESY